MTEDEFSNQTGHLPAHELRCIQSKELHEGRLMLRLSYQEARLHIQSTMDAEDFLSDVERKIALWNEGIFLLGEAAQLLEDTLAINAKTMYESMVDAIRFGSLVFRENGVPVNPFPKDRTVLQSMPMCLSDVNTWLNNVGAGYLLKSPYPDFIGKEVDSSSLCARAHLLNIVEDTALDSHTYRVSNIAVVVPSKPKNEAQAKQNVNNNPLAMTKSALIARYSHIWPTVEADILSAAINGLSTHARAVKRGWNEAKAVEWARSKGKINESENSSNQIASTMPSMTNLPTVVHRI